MIEHPLRAEITDIANHLLPTDAIMLSVETAYGKYPVEAVRNDERAHETEDKTCRKYIRATISITK